MSQNKPGLIVRLIRGIWNTLNFTRRLIFNAVFVILLFMLFAALFALDLVIPDPLPFFDEIMLALGTTLLAALRSRHDSSSQRPPDGK